MVSTYCPEVCWEGKERLRQEEFGRPLHRSSHIPYVVINVNLISFFFFLNVCLSGRSGQSVVCTGGDHPLPSWRFSERVDRRFMGVKGPDIRNSGLDHWEKPIEKTNKTKQQQQTNKQEQSISLRLKKTQVERRWVGWESQCLRGGHLVLYITVLSLFARYLLLHPPDRTKSQASFCAIKNGKVLLYTTWKFYQKLEVSEFWCVFN